MRLSVFSHCAIDTINLEGSQYEQIGGAACYCSMMARQFKFDVDLYTKFGSDFPTQYLTENKINFENVPSGKPTTRFEIDINGADRTLKLKNECEPIEFSEFNSDGTIISPIFHELSDEVFKKIKTNSNFTFLDPQGFLRKTDAEKKIILEQRDIDLSDVNAIKVNLDEMQSIVNATGDKGMIALQKKGVENVILTNNTQVSLLVKDRIYSISLPNKEIHDTTGIGDIFCAAFCCTLLKEKDFLWALCFGGGAAQAALDSKDVGLLKIPKKGAVETNASYFYNLVKYRQI